VVQSSFKGISLAVLVDASTPSDIEMETLAKRLLACGGAHKPTKYVFGPGQEYSLLDLLGAAGPRSSRHATEESKATSPTSATTTDSSPPPSSD
jgi:hypothetical protein